MSYALGIKSRLELRGVHPELVEVVRYAIEVTTQDFRVVDGLRTREEQADLVARGASRTMNSKHLPQADGYSHAVDLVPVVNGVLRWEWPLIYPIAHAMHIAAEHHDVPLTWGGVWDRPLLSLASNLLPMEVEHYVERRKRIGKTAFLDGPHYQIGVP